MPTRVLFRRDSDVVISEAEIRRRLSGVLGETEITISLTLDENEDPVEAVAEIPINTETSHVPRLFKAFRAMGWSDIGNMRPPCWRGPSST